MGTRNLIMVIDLEGKSKIAQYAQWDGYPSGQGLTALRFMSDRKNGFNLLSALDRCRFIDDNGKDKAFIDSYNKNAPEWSSDPDNRTPEQIRWFKSYISRNIGASILQNVAQSEDDEILLRDQSDFVNDSLFCEWAYVIDFHKNTFEVYEGFNKQPLNESDRFFKELPEDTEYHPVKMVQSFDLTSLPTEDEFMEKFTVKEEE